MSFFLGEEEPGIFDQTPKNVGIEGGGVKNINFSWKTFMDAA